VVIRARPIVTLSNIRGVNMSSLGIYPGSFNPWHEGHEDILKKALLIFDKIIILQGHNPNKIESKDNEFLKMCENYPNVETGFFSGLLAEAVKDIKPSGIIRGLRNGYDLEYEINMQYWNEDLGVICPFVYFITDRKYGHISSSAIRELKGFKKRKV
jgi:pantetheine-phosphate adenylyltransferase